MAQVCQICEKRKVSGSNVSFSLNRTKRLFRPNIVKARVLIDGKLTRVRVCAKCLKGLTKIN